MAVPKAIEFRGSSLDDLRGFPLAAMREAGHQLDQIQHGLEADDWKPMGTVGAGVKEVRIRDAAGASGWSMSPNMKLRSILMRAIKQHIVRSEMSQAEAAQLLGVTQPRVSDLMRGKISLFALDALVNMASAAGLRIEMRVREPA